MFTSPLFTLTARFWMTADAAGSLLGRPSFRDRVQPEWILSVCRSPVLLAFLLSVWFNGTCPVSAQVVESASAQANGRHQRVKVIVEVTGHVGGSDAGSKAGPLEATGTLLYEEFVSGGADRFTARFYEQAEATVRVADHRTASGLRPDHRLLVIGQSTEEAKESELFFSPSGPLTRRELELLQVPGGTHLLSELFPTPLPGSKSPWAPSDRLVARLLNLDHVSAQDVKIQLVDASGGKDHIRLAGHVVGTVQGAVTDIELEAKVTRRRADQTVDWFAMTLTERREASAVAPKFQVQARVRAVAEPLEKPRHLTARRLAQLDGGSRVARQQVLFQPLSGQFKLQHTADWYVGSDRPHLAVLRKMVDGRVVAQCNLRPLGGSSENVSALPMSEFQADVRQALGKRFGQMVDAQEFTQPNGTRVLRITAVGTVEQTPIQWIYYHLTTPEGQRMSASFTGQVDEQPLLGTEDLEMMESLTFVNGVRPL